MSVHLDSTAPGSFPAAPLGDEVSLGGDLFQLVISRVCRGLVIADGDFVAMSLSEG